MEVKTTFVESSGKEINITKELVLEFYNSDEYNKYLVSHTIIFGIFSVYYSIFGIIVTCFTYELFKLSFLFIMFSLFGILLLYHIYILHNLYRRLIDKEKLLKFRRKIFLRKDIFLNHFWTKWINKNIDKI